MFKNLMAGLAAVAAIAAPGCADPAAPTAAPPKSGTWRIDPGADLNAFFDCLEAKGITLVSAHRGGPYPGLPENALETMAKVLAAAPALVEIDVASSSDGVLHLMHDDTLDRTTTGEGAAAKTPFAAISRLALEDNDGVATPYRVPSFADALAFLKDRTIVQIDFKRSARYEDVIAEVKRQGADSRVIYIAYSLASAERLHRLHPEAMISLSLETQSELNRAVAAGIPADRLLGFTGVEEPKPRLFNQLNDRDVEVIFGTLGGVGSIDRRISAANDEAEYARIAALGVDIIATDRPLEAHAALVTAGRGATAGLCGVSRG